MVYHMWVTVYHMQENKGLFKEISYVIYSNGESPCKRSRLPQKYAIYEMY